MMLRSEMILQELKEHSPGLIQIQPTQVYTVPHNYFEQFAGNLLLKIREDEVASLFPSPQNPFAVPNNYFNKLPHQILQRIQQQDNSQQTAWEELEEVAPLLNQISKMPVYSVPPGYFERTDFTPVQEQTKAKVIGFSKTRKWIIYAAAAVMAGILVTGALWNNTMLTSSINAFSLNKEITNVSDEAIQNYLNNDITAPAYVNDTASIDTDGTMQDVQEILQNISDDELKGYLKATEGVVNLPVAAETKQKVGS